MKNKIAYYRGVANVSQSDLRKFLGFSQPRISNYELGVRDPCLHDCRQIVAGLRAFGAVTATLDTVFPESKSS